MDKINASDWELLNAYHDGELSAVERLQLERRISGDPSLAGALDDISSLAAALRELRPGATAAGGFFRRKLAIAASVAIAMVLAGALYTMRSAEPGSPTAWHAEFLALDYAVQTPQAIRPAAMFGSGTAPDLSSANLTLVDQRQGSDGARALHYAGRNGCRLTVTAGYGTDLPVAAATADVSSRSWQVGGVGYVVLANGMDVARFDAIAAYIRQLVERSAEPELILAMRSATKRAVPCSSGNVL